ERDPLLDRQQKQTFAEQGYIVVPQLVPQSLIDAAKREIANKMADQPPPAGHSGPHTLFLADPLPDSLCALLYGRAVIRAAESLIEPGKFEAPDHVQVSLNIPP